LRKGQGNFCKVSKKEKEQMQLEVLEEKHKGKRPGTNIERSDATSDKVHLKKRSGATRKIRRNYREKVKRN
jgi:hypothetical protein